MHCGVIAFCGTQRQPHESKRIPGPHPPGLGGIGCGGIGLGGSCGCGRGRGGDGRRGPQCF